MTFKIKDIVEMLYAYSQRSTAIHCLAAAVISKTGDVLSKAENENMGDLMGKKSRKLRIKHPRHAEEKALDNMKKHMKHIRLKYSSRKIKGTLHMVVVRRNANGLSLAKPCKNCYIRMLEDGISYVHYTDKFGEIISRRCSVLDIADYSESSLRKNIKNRTLNINEILKYDFEKCNCLIFDDCKSKNKKSQLKRIKSIELVLSKDFIVYIQ